ncbi:MAG: guanylate cyclase [Geobacteraceae bacterium GWC2_58_44]|nr:MAG: guanylate cyclase [Geobacteraceae bacterium GWC2_58_44]HBG04325.1 adenylate/guanylate cyclase domain-containing protein [Geobacter sp.]
MKDIGTATIRFVIGCAVTAVFCLLLVRNPLPLEITEAKLYDFRLHARGIVAAPDTVVIAAIDEESLARLGRWPWSREIMARLVDKLARADAAVIAFDVILPESEKNDLLLSRAIDNAGNVILPIAFDLEGEGAPLSDPILEQSALVSVEDAGLYRSFAPIMSRGVPTLPVGPLRESAMSLAHITMLPDHFDGTLRWEALLIGHQGLLYPSLGLRSAAFFKGIPPEQLKVRATRSIALGKSVIPTDRWGRMPINYYGPGGTLRHISVADILDDKAGVKELGNRIVFVGATAIGLLDLRVTPFTAVMPGVEKQATVAASILDNRLLSRATPLQDLCFLLSTGVLLALALSRLRLVWGAIAALAGMVCIGAGAVVLFNHLGLWVNLACPLGNAICMFMSVTAWNYAFEERHARRIRAMFSSYVTTTIVNELIKNPELARLGGEKREITVLFSDIRGFTGFSEQHEPEEVVALLNEYLGAMTDVILKCGGTLDKFIGDAVMVFWNAPILSEDHAERAVRCALEMQARLAQLHDKWDREGKPKLCCGIGINTGEVIVGNIGADGKKMDYTVIGDHVNLASRVESLTRSFGADILVTEMTVAKLRSAVDAGTLHGMEINGLRRVIVKGKQQAVTLYRVTASAAPVIITECAELEPLRLTEK